MNWLRWIVGILVCAWVGQYLLAMAVPSVVMELLYHRGGKAQGFNTLYVSPAIDETSRLVVRPSPDLLYAGCIYNLAKGPVKIEAPVPQRYWAMQFYQMNTDNYAGISNRRDEPSRVRSVVRVTLIGPDDEASNFEGEVIQSPTERGMMLIRASGIGDVTEARTALEGSSCTRV